MTSSVEVERRFLIKFVLLCAVAVLSGSTVAPAAVAQQKARVT
jgi:hypothetical protein